MDTAKNYKPSGLHELHLRARQLDQVAIFQGYRISLDGRPIQCGISSTLNVVDHKPLLAAGNRCHRNTRLANRSNHFCQWNLPS